MSHSADIPIFEKTENSLSKDKMCDGPLFQKRNVNNPIPIQWSSSPKREW